MDAPNAIVLGDAFYYLEHMVPENSVDLFIIDPPRNGNPFYMGMCRQPGGPERAPISKTLQKAVSTLFEISPTTSALLDSIKGYSPWLHHQFEIWEHHLPNELLVYLAHQALIAIFSHRDLRKTGHIVQFLSRSGNHHYVKVVFDMVYGPGCYRNDVVVKRLGHHHTSKCMGQSSDALLWYSKHPTDYHWNGSRTPITDPEALRRKFPHTEPDGRWYSLEKLTSGGNSGKTYHYVFNGRPRPDESWEWMITEETMHARFKAGLIVCGNPKNPGKPGTVARMKMYADEYKGKAHQDIWDDLEDDTADVWTDIKTGVRGSERVSGFEGQKAVAVYDRFTRALTPEQGRVEDVFAGTGTAAVAAHQAGRRFVLVETCERNFNIMRNRLKRDLPQLDLDDTAQVAEILRPATYSAFKAALKRDPDNKGHWAEQLVVTRFNVKWVGPLRDGSAHDGHATFLNGGYLREWWLEVTTQKANLVSKVKKTLYEMDQRGQADQLVFVCLRNTKALARFAASKGTFDYHFYGGSRTLNRVEILTFEDFYADRLPEIPLLIGQEIVAAPKTDLRPTKATVDNTVLTDLFGGTGFEGGEESAPDDLEESWARTPSGYL